MNLVAQIAVAAAATEHHGNVQQETLIFGLIAAGIFSVLGLVTFSYRHVANRHSAAADAASDEHGAGHGH